MEEYPKIEDKKAEIENAKPKNEPVQSIEKPSSTKSERGKKTKSTDGVKPRFALADSALTNKIKLPDLNNLDDPNDKSDKDEPVLNIKEKKRLSRENVHKVWESYVEKLQIEKNTSGELLFKDREIEIHLEQEFILIHFENSVQLDNFEELKMELMFYLRQNLSNPDLKITAEVRKNKKDSKRLYTDQDKLDYLIEKNPIIKELTNNLGLDVNY